MKKVLITGAGGGLMRVVIENIKDRYFIYATVHTEKQLELLKKRYDKEKNIICFVLDVTKESDRKKVIDLEIDIFIYNAAIGYGGSIVDMNMNKVRENFEVNVFSNFELLQKIVQKMVQQQSGKIINIASLAGIVPIPFIGSYAASKSAIIKLTETLKQELKMISNIDVCLIEPGFYDTGFNQVMFDNKDIDLYFKEIKEYINKSQDFIRRWIEKKNLNSIVFKIINCIDSKHPRFIYRAPCSQVIFSKIYCLFFQ